MFRGRHRQTDLAWRGVSHFLRPVDRSNKCIPLPFPAVSSSVSCGGHGHPSHLSLWVPCNGNISQETLKPSYCPSYMYMSLLAYRKFTDSCSLQYTSKDAGVRYLILNDSIFLTNTDTLYTHIRTKRGCMWIRALSVNGNNYALPWSCCLVLQAYLAFRTPVARAGLQVVRCEFKDTSHHHHFGFNPVTHFT